MPQPRPTGAAPARPLSPSAVEDFRARLRGPLVERGDAGYETARRVYNAMIDKYPRMVVLCRDAADVVACVDFARDAGLPLAVRGGGHNVAGLGTVDDGLVADLSPMRGIRVDPERRLVRAQGGCTWGDLDHATHAFGLAVPAGLISTTGIAGLTLGGGVGHLTRRYGLSCDNLVSADVVTADGELVHASEEENPDLFWALRGGGGNFGVVTEFEFRAHPVSMIVGGPLFYPLDKAEEVLRAYDRLMQEAPDELSAFYGFQMAPPTDHVPEHLHLKTMCIVVPCWTGPIEEADAALQPLRDLGPALDLATPMPLPALNSLFDDLLPPGLHHYWKGDYLTDLNEAAIEVHLQHGPDVPNLESTMHVYPMNGAASRVPPDATAFAHRDARYLVVIAAMYPDPEATPERVQWVRDYYEALHPHASGATYVNFLMDDEGDARIRASYGDHYPKLRAIKTRWDPANLFHVNQNIEPAQ